MKDRRLWLNQAGGRFLLLSTHKMGPSALQIQSHLDIKAPRLPSNRPSNHDHSRFLLQQHLFASREREMHRMKTSLSFSNASWFWRRRRKKKNEKKHKLPENWIKNLTGRERSHGFLTVTERLKSALHFIFFSGVFCNMKLPPPFPFT